VVIAQDSGNRGNESHLALNLAWLEAEHGDTASAFDHLTLSIRNYHDSGNTARLLASRRVPCEQPGLGPGSARGEASVIGQVGRLGCPESS
jgi:hypothetical protein